MSAWLFVVFAAWFIDLTSGRGTFLQKTNLSNEDSRSQTESILSEQNFVFRREIQAALDRREFQVRQLRPCRVCAAPTMPAEGCVRGFKPTFEERLEDVVWKENAARGATVDAAAKRSEKNKQKCSCIASYECCPEKCGSADDEVMKQCWAEHKGRKYPHKITDCCDCPEWACRPCPSFVDFGCNNPCDVVAERKNELTRCAEKYCARKPDPGYEKKECQPCERPFKSTDDCGFHKEECACQEVPGCRPPRPDVDGCHELVEEPVEGLSECVVLEGGERKCRECVSWKFVVKPIVNDDGPKCLSPCQTTKMTYGECGNYTKTCECLTPADCRPLASPSPPPCHVAVKVWRGGSFACAENGTACLPCYRWEMKLKKSEEEDQVHCDRDCMHKVPVMQDCGIVHRCECNSKTSSECRPQRPPELDCYVARQEMINGSFMCHEELEEAGPGRRLRLQQQQQRRRRRPRCLQCWSWRFKKRPCEKSKKKPECLTDCQKAVSRDVGCGCTEIVCESEVVPNCRPPKPEVDVCYEEPEMTFPGISSYEEEGKMCVRCYHWSQRPKVFEHERICEHDSLPRSCYSDYTEKTRCGQLVTKCKKNAHVCEEQFEECPTGTVKVTLKSGCGEDRDACLDCAAWFPVAAPTLPRRCFRVGNVNFLGGCDVKTYEKLPCSADLLSTSECKVNGQKRKLVYDECQCPELKCTGCPVGYRLDLQLLLDSSNAVTRDVWTVVIEALKIFVDLIMRDGSRLAVARYGEYVEHLEDLSFVSPSSFNHPKYEMEKMGEAKTGEVLTETFHRFSAQARWNQAEVPKILVVILNGPAPSGQDVASAAKLWRDAGARIVALGIGDIDEDGLKLVSPNNYKKLDSKEELALTIQTQLVEDVCTEPRNP